VTAGPIVI